MPKAPIISQTIPIGTGGSQANLIKNKFDQFIFDKGYRVVHEIALLCPCKSRNANQLSNCKNCGGSGWIFCNPTATRMVMHSMNLDTKWKMWSEENAGTTSISSMSEDNLSYMDRITVVDGQAIFWEVMFLKTIFADDQSVSQSESHSHSSESGSHSDSRSEQAETVYYFSTLYPIKEILYLAIFNGSQNKLIPLKYGVDFTYSYNDSKIVFLTAQPWIDRSIITQQDVSVTIKYKYAPMYYIADIPRENIQSNVKLGLTEEVTLENLPVKGVGKRMHYNPDMQNYDATRVISNDHLFTFDELNPPQEKLC